MVVVPDGALEAHAFSLIDAAMSWAFPDTMPCDGHHLTANLVAAAERYRDAMQRVAGMRPQ
jgi:hypothetical protein